MPATMLCRIIAVTVFLISSQLALMGDVRLLSDYQNEYIRNAVATTLRLDILENTASQLAEKKFVPHLLLNSKQYKASSGEDYQLAYIVNVQTITGSIDGDFFSNIKYGDVVAIPLIIQRTSGGQYEVKKYTGKESDLRNISYFGSKDLADNEISLERLLSEDKGDARFEELQGVANVFDVVSPLWADSHYDVYASHCSLSEQPILNDPAVRVVVRFFEFQRNGDLEGIGTLLTSSALAELSREVEKMGEKKYLEFTAAYSQKLQEFTCVFALARHESGESLVFISYNLKGNQWFGVRRIEIVNDEKYALTAELGRDEKLRYTNEIKGVYSILRSEEFTVTSQIPIDGVHSL